MKTTSLAAALTAAILLAACATGAARAQDTLYQTRALWIAAEEFIAPEKADRVIDNAQRSNMNVLLPQVFCSGHAFFKNSFVEMDARVATDFDPLQYLIDKAHAAGLEVHPWFCIATTGDPVLKNHPEFKAEPPPPGMIIDEARAYSWDEFANVHHAGYRDFVIDLMLECVKNYEVEGLHYDYIRSGTTSFDEDSRRGFMEKFGKPLEQADNDELHAWHAAAVEDIVIRATERAREARPGLIVSAAVFSNIPWVWWQGQDARKWAQNNWVDVIFTMDYEMSAELVKFNEMNFIGKVPKSSHAVGLATYMEDPVKGYTARPASLVIDQMKVLRKLNIDQIAFFREIFMSDEIIDALTRGPFREKAAPYFRKPAGGK